MPEYYRMQTFKGYHWKESPSISELCFLICWLHPQAGSPLMLTNGCLGSYLYTSATLTERVAKSSNKILGLTFIKSMWVSYVSISKTIIKCRKWNKLISPILLSRLNHPGSYMRRVEGRKQRTPFGPDGQRDWEPWFTTSMVVTISLSPLQFSLLPRYSF